MKEKQQMEIQKWQHNLVQDVPVGLPCPSLAQTPTKVGVDLDIGSWSSLCSLLRRKEREAITSLS